MIRHSVTFSLLPRERRDGTRSVQVTVTWIGHRVRHTLPVSAPSDAWDAVRQRARNTRTFRGAEGVIRVVTQKTADPLTIPLNRYAREIIARTLPSPSSGLLLPVISNQNSNYQLKDAAMLAQLDRPVSEVYYVGSERLERTSLAWEVITTHWARRTFVVNALRLGIPAEVVMKFTGHSSYAAMRPYIDVADETKRRFMSLFDA